MTKQTAVDFFHDEVNKLLPKKIITTNDIGLIWVKAKKMEKQQIIDSFKIGNHSEMRGGKILLLISEQYYKENYGGKNEI